MLSVIPPRGSSAPERLVGASPIVERTGRRVIGIDVSKLRLDVYRLADGRRLAVGNDAGGIAARADQLGLGRRP